MKTREECRDYLFKYVKNTLNDDVTENIFYMVSGEISMSRIYGIISDEEYYKLFEKLSDAFCGR